MFFSLLSHLSILYFAQQIFSTFPCCYPPTSPTRPQSIQKQLIHHYKPSKTPRPTIFHTENHHEPPKNPYQTHKPPTTTTTNPKKSTKLLATTAKHSKIHTHRHFTPTISTRTHIKPQNPFLKQIPKLEKKNLFFLKPSTQKSPNPQT